MPGAEEYFVFCFLFLAPYARTTRYEEAFFRWKTKDKKARFARAPHDYITILRTNTNTTMTRIGGGNVGIMILVNNIYMLYRLYILTYCSLGLTMYGKCNKCYLRIIPGTRYTLCVMKNMFNYE